MMRAMKNLSLTTTVLTLCLLAAGAAHAADKPKKESSFGSGSGAMLTKEQLRSCLGQKAHLAQLDDELVKEQAALAVAKDDVARSGDALKAQLETVDRSNADAVAAYNDQAQARDKQIDDYQARVGAFNTRVDASKAEREAFGKACVNRRFLEDDEIAIKKGK
jgi:Skp family chaperone for outer membrane proteins